MVADEGTVRDVIHRFNEIGRACLDPRCAGGRHGQLSPQDEDFVVQTATTRPTKLGQPCTRWSLEEGADSTLAALRSFSASRPDGALIHVILDNLSAPKGEKIRRWAKGNRVELCFTPTYASCANPIEHQFGPLRQFTIANSNHRHHTARTRALHAYLRWRNATAPPSRRAGPQRREGARIHSERGVR